jgi:AsmA protein
MATKRSPTHRLLRFVGFGLLNLVLLIVVIALVAPLLFDPNDYKDTIAEQVKARTGRELTIVGDMSFTVLPWLDVSTGEVRLGNTAGEPQSNDTNKPFARLSSADVRVKLVPLLSREVQIDTVNVRGLEVHLARDVNGRGNWEGLAAQADSAAVPGTQPTEDSGGGDGIALAAFALGGVHFEDAAVTFIDARSGEQISLSDVDIRTGAVSIGEPVDAQVSLRFAHPAALGKASGKARLSYDHSSKRIAAPGLELSTELEAPALGAGISSAKVSGAVSYDDATRQIIGNSLVFTLSVPLPDHSTPGAPIEISGAGDVNLRLIEQTVTSSDLQLTVKNLRTGANSASVQLHSDVVVNLTSQQLALTTLRGDAQLSGEPITGGPLPVNFGANVTVDLATQSVQAKNLKLTAEGLSVAGDLFAESLASTPVVSGTLAAPEFALRTVLARFGVALPATRDPKVLKAAAFSGKFKYNGKGISIAPLELQLDGAALRGKLAASTSGALEFDLSTDRLNVDRYLPATAPGAPPPAALGALPVSILRDLDIKGSIKVGALRYSGLDLSKVSVGINAKDAQLRLSPLQANLYGGRYKGNIRIDARNKLPVMYLNEQVSKINADALFKALKVSTGVLDLRGGRTSLTLKTTVTTDAAGKKLRADNVVLDGRVSGRSFKGGAVPFKLHGNVLVDLDAKRASVKKASARFAELKVAGDLETHFAPGKLRYEGALSLTPFNLRKLASRLGVPLPRSANSKAVRSIGGKAKISGNSRSVKASAVTLKLDRSTITGDISVLDFASLALSFNVDVNRINIDDYLPPSAKRKTATPGAAVTALPVDLVRSLNLDGELRIGKLEVSGVKLSKVVVTAKAKSGLLKLSPLGAVLYQGRYDGNVTMDARGAAPRISLDETIKGVQIGALLKDVRGDAPLTGATDLRATLTATGGNTEVLKRTVDGKLSFAIRNGTLEKVDMVNSMCTTLAALDFDNLNKKTITTGILGLLLNATKSKPQTRANAAGSSTRTEFTDMTGTAVIAKGIARNNDLVMVSPIVRVRGAGTINLPSDWLDYRAEAELCKVASESANATSPGSSSPSPSLGQSPNRKCGRKSPVV